VAGDQDTPPAAGALAEADRLGEPIGRRSELQRRARVPSSRCGHGDTLERYVRVGGEPENPMGVNGGNIPFDGEVEILA
jgi:hypothetical protein